jgi:hypothetical protein
MQSTMIAIGSKSAHHLPTSAPAPKWARATGKTHSPKDASGPYAQASAMATSPSAPMGAFHLALHLI